VSYFATPIPSATESYDRDQENLFRKQLESNLIEISSFFEADLFSKKNPLLLSESNVSTFPSSFGQNFYNVKDFGARGDGATDDSGSINKAILDANADGGGIVFFPSGTYMVGNTSGSICLDLLSNVYLMGSGAPSTKIKMLASQNSHVIQGTHVSNCQISDMEVDANGSTGSPSQVGVHAIHFYSSNGSHTDNIKIFRVKVSNSRKYGMGFQAAAGSGGSFRKIWIDSCWIKDSGGDGIDFKNESTSVANANRDIFISNVAIDNFGTGSDHGSSAGIDIRGSASLTNIQVFQSGTSIVAPSCIRFQIASNASGALEDARECSLSSFYCKADSNQARGLVLGGSRCSVSSGAIDVTGTSAMGINVDASAVAADIDGRQNTVSNVVINGNGTALNGITLSDDADRNVFSNCNIFSFSRGIFSSGGIHNIIQSCKIQNSGTHGIWLFGDGSGSGSSNPSKTVVKNNTILDSTNNGIVITADAVDTILTGNTYQGNSKPIDNSSPTTRMSSDFSFGASPPSVAGAGVLTLPYYNKYYYVDGTNSSVGNIGTIRMEASNTAAVNSMEISIIWEEGDASDLGFTLLNSGSGGSGGDTNNIKLKNSAAIANARAGSIVTLVWTGSYWQEVSRSITTE
jgi:hypothetical protein